MDGKTPLRAPGVRLPLGDISNEIEATVCAPYLSSGACVHSRGLVMAWESDELRPHSSMHLSE